MKKKDAQRFTLSLINTTPAVYLATVTEQGFPQIRAVTNLRDANLFADLRPVFEDLGNPFGTYITTFSTSKKSKQIGKDSRVALYYCRPELFHGVMLSGRMETVRDRAVGAALWQDEWAHFWPAGPSDRRYRVFRFDPVSTRGWSSEEQFSFTIR